MPLVVALIGLLGSAIGTPHATSPPWIGWNVKSPLNVTVVPTFTLMHGGA